jgi:hypothetical protein
MFTSPTAQYFGWDNGYQFGRSFRVGLSTQQVVANFTLTVFYSINAGADYLPYGTINVVRPSGGVPNYAYGNYVDLDFSTIQPVNQKFYLKINGLPATLQGSNAAAGLPNPMIQIVLDAVTQTGGNGETVAQMNTRFSSTVATEAPTTVNAVLQ